MFSRNAAFAMVLTTVCFVPASYAQSSALSQPLVTDIGPNLTLQNSQSSVQTSSQSSVHKEQYVLKFTAREVEGGRTVNARDFSVRTYADNTTFESAQIRTGGRVPVPAGTGGGVTQFTYIDVGINFDLKEIQISGSNLNLKVSADISSYKTQDQSPQPVIQQNKWQGSVTIPVGKTATIFSSDDVVSKRTLQIDLTVTHI